MAEKEKSNRQLSVRMFEDGNRVRFATPVDKQGRDWWLERFYHPHNLTPEAMGSLLTKSVAGEKRIKYEFIDGVGQAFRLRVEGALSGVGDIWFVERTFELQGIFFNADEMFIPSPDRAAGHGRRVMGDLIDAARSVGADRIKIQARNIGRYAWLRMGFRPDAGSWRDMRKNLVFALHGFRDTLGPGLVDQLSGMIARGQPDTANVVASFGQAVPSGQLRDQFGQPMLVSLGKALILEYAGDWDGEFVLADPEMTRVATDYLKGGEHD